jgi:hypothetical protein
MRGDDLVTYGVRARRRLKRRVPARPSIAAGSAVTGLKGDAVTSNRSLLVRTNPLAGRSEGDGNLLVPLPAESDSDLC